jgi:hypothetical protein
MLHNEVELFLDKMEKIVPDIHSLKLLVKEKFFDRGITTDSIVNHFVNIWLIKKADKPQLLFE